MPFLAMDGTLAFCLQCPGGTIGHALSGIDAGRVRALEEGWLRLLGTRCRDCPAEPHCQGCMAWAWDGAGLAPAPLERACAAFRFSLDHWLRVHRTWRAQQEAGRAPGGPGAGS
jgi:hypothetical protein